MNEPDDSLTRLLADVIFPNLKVVQASQAEQIAASDRLELALTELRTHLDSQFAQLAAQLTACRAELAIVHEVLKAVRTQGDIRKQDGNTLVH
jgi:indole-3-glycerol phosphate synthase